MANRRYDLPPRRDMLHTLLACNPMRGELVWQVRPLSMFDNSRAASRWNACYAGKAAFNTIEPKGYKSGKLFGRRFKAHRVIWAWVYDEWPDEIDHINGDKTDNRLINLRSVTHRENGLNVRKNSRNKSGHMGVYQRPSGSWYAVISDNSRRFVVGTYRTKEEAIAARRAAERQHGYHQNHGRIAA